MTASRAGGQRIGVRARPGCRESCSPVGHHCLRRNPGSLPVRGAQSRFTPGSSGSTAAESPGSAGGVRSSPGAPIRHPGRALLRAAALQRGTGPEQPRCAQRAPSESAGPGPHGDPGRPPGTELAAPEAQAPQRPRALRGAPRHPGRGGSLGGRVGVRGLMKRLAHAFGAHFRLSQNGFEFFCAYLITLKCRVTLL